MTLRIPASRVVLTVAMALAAMACGDDTGGGGGYADSGPAGGSGGAGGAGGTGGGTPDSGPMVDVAACVAAGDTASTMGFGTRTTECKECICGKCTMPEVTACDDNCWALIACVADMCTGLEGNERLTCAVMKCIDLLAAQASATAIGDCAFGTDSCETACRAGDAGTPADDAGADDGG